MIVNKRGRDQQKIYLDHLAITIAIAETFRTPMSETGCVAIFGPQAQMAHSGDASGAQDSESCSGMGLGDPVTRECRR